MLRPLSLCFALVLACACMAQAPPSRQLALTIDDVPGAFPGGSNGDINELRAITWRMLEPLRSHKVPAIAFVNEAKLYVPGELDTRIDELRKWRDAGIELGNHGYSHLRFQDAPLSVYEDDAIQGEVITSRLLGEKNEKERFYRYPFNSTGPTREARDAFQQFLHDRGYSIAPFTIEHADYIFNEVYVHAHQSRDSELTQRVRKAYLDHLDVVFDYFEGLSQQMFGRNISQILLIHANDLNSDVLDDMLTDLEKRGYKFVSLQQALEDPAYQSKDDYVGPLGISWLDRWKVARGMKLHIEAEPDPPKWILETYGKLHPAR